MATSVKKTLEKGYFIDLDFHIWSGAKRLKAEDLGLTDPPKELVSLGTKRIFPPERIQEFRSLKRRAERILDAIAIRFMKGWYVPETRIEEATGKLDEICKEFDGLKAQTRLDYDKMLRDFVDQHPEFGELIEHAAEPASVVDHRLQASYNVISVKGLCPEHGQHNGATRQAKGLRGRLYSDVAKAAEEAWESIKDRDRVNRTSVGRIERIRCKLEGLQFLDPGFGNLVRAIDDVLVRLPPEGVIEETPLVGLKSLVMLLRDPGTARELGQNQRQVSWAETAAEPETNSAAEQGEDDTEQADTHASVPQQRPASDRPANPLGGLGW